MSDASITRGGVKNPVLAIVSADQSSIVGDGTTEHPLRAPGAAQTTFVATYTNPNAVPEVLGQAVVVSATPSPTVGITTVTPGFTFFGGQPQAVGLIVGIADGGIRVTVQTSGTVTLTTAEWDNTAQTTGGLTPGTVYYLDTTFTGALTDAPPGAPGTFLVQVGIALSATELLLSLPAFPIVN